MNKEDYVSYETAKLLKDAGFYEPCDHYYYKKYNDRDYMEIRKTQIEDYNSDDLHVPHCSAPTLWKVQKWLREEHQLSVEPYANMIVMWNYTVVNLNDFAENMYSGVGYATYEAALSAGIEASLKQINENKKKG